MKKHANLSIFVPHMGCPCRCSFCDQRTISGTQTPPDYEYVTRLCDEYLPQSGFGDKTEIAFFGGSFTAIEREYMLTLLKAAYPFVKNNRAAGIRISTRPDAIDTPRLDLLREYGVTAIELGAQSMSDDVLLKNRRGHDAQSVVTAARLIKEYGFSLGLQMMTGLYGEKDYDEGALYTMRRFIELMPETVRIYPTLILQGTMLCELYEKGEYIPQSLESSVKLCARLITGFTEKGIKVIRVGLHADSSMQARLVAGPFHPAFRQLCESEIYKEQIDRLLLNKPHGEYTIVVPKGQRSTAAGQKNVALAQLADQGYNIILQESETVNTVQLKL